MPLFCSQGTPPYFLCAFYASPPLTICGPSFAPLLSHLHFFRRSQARTFSTLSLSPLLLRLFLFPARPLQELNPLLAQISTSPGLCSSSWPRPFPVLLVVFHHSQQNFLGFCPLPPELDPPSFSFFLIEVGFGDHATLTFSAFFHRLFPFCFPGQNFQ